MSSRTTVLTSYLRPIPAGFPEELGALDQWVVWKAEVRAGQPTKVPYDPWSRLRASVSDPGTWTSLEWAKSAYEEGGFAGIGFVLTAQDPFIAVDLDRCLDAATGAVSEVAMRWVNALSTYTEVSPSGRGLRLILTGNLGPGWRKRGGIEVYDRGRYVTMTGRRFQVPQ